MSRNLFKILIDALASQDVVGYVNEADIANVTELGFYVEFGAGTGAGVVLIETASNTSYAGTWAVLSTVTWSAASKSHYVGVTDALAVVRARIGTAVTGGTVTVKVVGNNR